MASSNTPPWPHKAVSRTPAPPATERGGVCLLGDTTRRCTTAISSLAIGTIVVTAGATLLGLSAASLRTVSLLVLVANALACLVPLAALVTDGRVDPAVRRSWQMLALAMVAQCVSLVGRDLGPQRVPAGVVNAAIILFHPLIFGAVAALPCGLRTGLDRLRLLFDVFVTAGAATTLTLTLMPEAYGAANHGSSTLVALAGVLGDAMLFATIAMLWLRGMLWRWRDALTPLAVACAIEASTQLIRSALAGVAAAQMVDAMLVLPLALVGLSAVWHRSKLVNEGVQCGAPRRLSVLPTASAGLVLLTLVCSVLAGATVERMAIVSASLVGLAALVRQVLGIRGEIDSQALDALEQADRRLAALVRHGSDMLMILEPDTTVRYASPSHFQVMGVPPEMLVGTLMATQIHRDDMPAAELRFERLRSGQSQQESLVVRLRDSTGAWRWVEAIGTNLSAEPTIAGLVLNSRDITDRKVLEAQLLEQALRDPLTGLGNRRLFSDRVMHALERRLRHGGHVALLLLDLDHFKFINDTLGHAKGDALLIAVSERLRSALRTGDTVARLGGDEFAVLLEDLGRADEADATALRIQQALDRSFRLDEREVFVRSSIGIAWATDGQDVDALLADADVAMYGAKNSGRGRVERFSSEMRASVAERLDLEADLRFALERGELDLVYQPVVDLETGRVSGAEALIRWTHPEHGMVLPGRFIPVAEESDLIIDIGRFVIRRAAIDAARFRGLSAATSRLRVAVNLSARHLLSPELVSDVADALGAAGVPGAAMAVELTESVLASNEPVVAGRLQGLRDMGLRVALDDFGTGYSSLAYLRRFPIDVLKVDKSFVSYGQEDVGNDGVTKAIVSIGLSLGMRTVAEGVETAEQLERLRAIGCALGQGYLFSRPISRDAFETLLLEWNGAAFANQSLTTDGVAPLMSSSM